MPAPTPGRIVLYALSEQDAEAINRRREDFKLHMVSGEFRAHPTGYIGHYGNPAEAGQTYPALIVRTWGDTKESAVNLQVLLDGNDTYWATSRHRGDDNGHWQWPDRPATRDNTAPAAPAEHAPQNSADRDLDFGEALAAAKGGARIARDGWNGHGMYIVHQPGYPDGIAINTNTARATGIPKGTVCRFRPYLMLRTAQGDFVPWVASQSDLLASDWREA